MMHSASIASSAGAAPDEVSTLSAVGKFPDNGHYPDELVGLPFVAIAAVYAGPADLGEQVLKPIRDFGTPYIDISGVMPYVGIQQLFDAEFPDGKRYYWKSVNLPTVSDEIIAKISEHARAQVSIDSTTDLWHIGGAVRRANPDSSYNGRDIEVMVNFEANWYDTVDDDANRNWVRTAVADLEQFSDGSRYLNFAGTEDESGSLVKDAFGTSWNRLLELKNRYDPANVFRFNQNISEPKSVVDHWQR